MGIKHCTFNSFVPPRIVAYSLEDEGEGKSDMIKDNHILLHVSTGNRKLIRVYTFGELQGKLSDYMDSIKADDDNPDRNLKHVIERGHFYILEYALGTGLFPMGIPGIEEASKVTQSIFNSYDGSPDCMYFYLPEKYAEGFANYCGITWKEAEEALAKDIDRFNLKRVLFLHKYGAAVFANPYFLSFFSKENTTPRIIACT